MASVLSYSIATVDSAAVDSLHWRPTVQYVLLSMLHHSLQTFTVYHSSAAVLGDAAGQNESVQVFEDLFQSSQLDQLGIVECEVLSNLNPQVFKAAHPFHFKMRVNSG